MYLLLNHADISDNERRRAFYVGITRAKRELYLHYNGHAFDRFAEQVTDDPVLYPEPNQIMLQLTHRDVVLSCFTDKKKAILNLRSGDTLTLKGKCLYAQIGGKTIPAAILSKAAQDTLNQLYAKGYHVQSAQIRFVVAWRNQDETDDNEYAVILPDICLEK